MRMTNVLIAFAFTTPSMNGQTPPPDKSTIQFEYGTSKELRGVRTVYVDTNGDLELRDEVAAGITKALNNLVSVADKAEEAEVLVTYEGGVQSLGDGLWKKQRWASGFVSKPVGDHTVRLLLTFKRPPERYRVGASYNGDFVEAFVKAYRDANNLDKHNQKRPGG